MEDYLNDFKCLVSDRITLAIGYLKKYDLTAFNAINFKSAEKSYTFYDTCKGEIGIKYSLFYCNSNQLEITIKGGDITIFSCFLETPLHVTYNTLLYGKN